MGALSLYVEVPADKYKSQVGQSSRAEIDCLDSRF